MLALGLGAVAEDDALRAADVVQGQGAVVNLPVAFIEHDRNDVVRVPDRVNVHADLGHSVQRYLAPRVYLGDADVLVVWLVNELASHCDRKHGGLERRDFCDGVVDRVVYAVGDQRDPGHVLRVAVAQGGPNGARQVRGLAIGLEPVQGSLGPELASVRVKGEPCGVEAALQPREGCVRPEERGVDAFESVGLVGEVAHAHAARDVYDEEKLRVRHLHAVEADDGPEQAKQQKEHGEHAQADEYAERAAGRGARGAAVEEPHRQQDQRSQGQHKGPRPVLGKDDPDVADHAEKGIRVCGFEHVSMAAKGRGTRTSNAARPSSAARSGVP